MSPSAERTFDLHELDSASNSDVEAVLEMPSVPRRDSEMTLVGEDMGSDDKGIDVSDLKKTLPRYEASHGLTATSTDNIQHWSHCS